MNRKSARTMCRDMPIRYENKNYGKLILDLFGGKKGYFIDVGAAHPITLNHTYLLEEMGWEGLLVEPNMHFGELLASRKAKLLRAALWTHDGESDFHHGEQGSCLAQCGSGCLGCHNYTGKVRTITVATMLKEGNVPKRVDFMNVDAQGAEYYFYKDLPSAKVILMEIHNASWVEEICTYFESRGYKVRNLGINDYLFVRMSIVERIKKWILNLIKRLKTKS